VATTTTSTAPDVPRAAYVEQVMGLPVSIHVRGLLARSDAARSVVHDAFAWLRRVDALFSTYRPDSEISRIDAGHLSLADADPSVREVLLLAEQAEEMTDGLFCVRLPRPDGSRHLEPSGIVKGWAAERAFRIVAALEGHDVCLNAGGDVVVGTAGGGPAWRVGVERPGGGGVVAVVERVDGAVATSGTGARGHHLVDPRTGGSADALASMTVVGPSLMWADVLATAAFVRGADGVRWVQRFPGYQGLSIDHSGGLVASDGLVLPAA
jgi:thiamine biosynthesis lipoprotein